MRNNDELDLERLALGEREQVMAAFAPETSMRIYRRGIRRRLASMLNGDVNRQSMACALLFSMGPVPVIRYGEEIGMGDEPDLPERESVRTPMQWHDGLAGGFSECPTVWRAPISEGMFDYRRINVADQEAGDSLLNRMRSLADARRRLPAFDTAPTFIKGDKHVFQSVFGQGSNKLWASVNLTDQAVTVNAPDEFMSQGWSLLRGAVWKSPLLHLGRYGYAWISMVVPAVTNER